MHYLFTYVFIMVLIFTGCQKDTNSPNAAVDLIFGSWQWVESTGGIAGLTMTPESEGYTQKLYFIKPAVFHYFRNDSLKQTGTFQIQTGNGEPLILYHQEIWPLINEQFFRFYSADTLILIDNCDDCFTHRFVRIE